MLGLVMRYMMLVKDQAEPDVLLDASYKYSEYTTRLYVSRYRDGHLELTEAARLKRTAR